MTRNPRRRRGVPLNLLDRSQSYVIEHTGSRWEVVGISVAPARPWTTPAPDAGAGGEAPSTVPEPAPAARHRRD